MAKLKRLLAPPYWKVKRKAAKWTIAPSPGPHKKLESIPLGIVVRDILKLVEKGSEAKKLIKAGEIFVDGLARKSHQYPVGLMDVVTIPRIAKAYRVSVNKKGLKLIAITEQEASLKICQVTNKTKVKGGLTQLNLHDGRNILVKEDVYKTGDSLLIEIPSQKIVEHLKFEKGSLALILRGKGAGRIAKIEAISAPKFKQPSKIICRVNESRFELLKKHTFVVGEKKPLLTFGG